MRPFPGDDALIGRPRASDAESPLIAQQPAGPQMTYFLADEAAVDASLHQQTAFTPHRVREVRKGHTCDYADAGSATLLAHGNDRDSRPTSAKGLVEAAKHESGALSRPDSPAGKISVASNPPFSQPMTPILLGQSGPASALSSGSSRRNSLAGSLSEDVASQTLSVHEDHDKEQSSMMDSGSAPQLVMPSIKMPSRRPFTEEGKSMGRLKVLIAGDSGVGKTSLVKAIVQSCEHIVHVDPITPSHITLLAGRSGAKAKGRRPSAKTDTGTTQITEIYASTKPYPEWWSDLEDFQVLRRRKSLGDTVLDRNICFVDTPGFGSGSSAMDAITPVVQYVQSHLDRMYSNSLPDSDMLNMLGGDGGAQVDVVFYIILNSVKPADMQYLRLLAPLTNIIPILGQADLLDASQTATSKERVECQLREANIRTFSFAMSSPTGGTTPAHKGPYAISSATGSDHDTMDASLLMSPDYVQPLIPTELAELVERVFSHRGASWLRYSAARKYIHWRNAENPPKPMDLYRPLSFPATMAEPAMGHVVTSGVGAPTSFALARVTDHTHREERLAQIRLANWAAELQKSLANERARYEALAQGERAVWLTERLNECVRDGSLVPVTPSERSTSRMREKIRRKLARDRGHPARTMRHQDPLGLLEITADLKGKGWIALEILGSLGVLGGLALWLSKHYWHFQASEWLINEWTKFWSGER